MDFVRFLHAPLLSVAGGIVAVFFLAYVFMKFADEDGKRTIRKVRNWSTVVLLLCLAWFAFSAATVNNVPRATIDRSVVNERADTVKEQGRKANEAAKKGAEAEKR